LDGTQSKPENKKNQAKPLDPNQGPKVTEFTCKVPGDKNYAYTFKDNNWFALNLKNNKRKTRIKCKCIYGISYAEV
jgi:hypothetical protein